MIFSSMAKLYIEAIDINNITKEELYISYTNSIIANNKSPLMLYK